LGAWVVGMQDGCMFGGMAHALCWDAVRVWVRGWLECKMGACLGAWHKPCAGMLCVIRCCACWLAVYFHALGEVHAATGSTSAWPFRLQSCMPTCTFPLPWPACTQACTRRPAAPSSSQPTGPWSPSAWTGRRSTSRYQLGGGRGGAPRVHTQCVPHVYTRPLVHMMRARKDIGQHAHKHTPERRHSAHSCVLARHTYTL